MYYFFMALDVNTTKSECRNMYRVEKKTNSTERKNTKLPSQNPQIQNAMLSSPDNLFLAYPE